MNRKKNVGITSCLDATGRSHYNMCEFFVRFAIVLYLIRIIVSIINIIYAGIQPDAGITVEGEHHVFDMLIGIGRLGPDYLPADVPIINDKVLCIGFMLTALAVDFIPMLLVLDYIRKILKAIQNSHSPFIPEAAIYIKKAGKILILLGVFGKIAMKTAVQLLACRSVYSLGIPDDLQLPLIFAGVLVLLVSDIFRRGCELQQFSDETL